MGQLDGKVALITGAARGQGRAHALRLASAGADVIVTDTNADIESVPYPLANDVDLKSTAAAVEALGRRALSVSADIRSTSDVDEVVRRGLAEFGQIDILVANAGIFSYANFWDMSEEMWQDMIDVNLTGVWRTAKAVAPHMIVRNSGVMVLTASVNGFEPQVGAAHYVAAKHGVIGLMRNFANELAPYGVRCNAVCPGAIDTPMISNPLQYDRFTGQLNGTREDALESVRHYHLLKGKSMLPADAVSRGVLWLVSDDAEDVTGVALPIDAGNMVIPAYNPCPVK